MKDAYSNQLEDVERMYKIREKTDRRRFQKVRIEKVGKLD